MACVACNAALGNQIPYFELLHDVPEEPCLPHCLCVSCFGENHASRGCQPCFVCPLNGCDERIIGHCCWQKTTKTIRTKIVESKEVQRQPPVYIAGPSLTHDPCRYFCNRDEAFQKDHIMVSAQWRQPQQPGSDKAETTRSLVIESKVRVGSANASA